MRNPGLAAMLVTSVALIAPASGSAAVTYTDPAAFQSAIASLGTPVSVDFDELDASPVNNTWVGRQPFDGNTYRDSKGITFSNPLGYPLYIAPGGLFWNESNSLSVRQFPFDDNADDGNDDDLVVRVRPTAAIGFELVDNGSHAVDEFVQFIDANGAVVAQVGMPNDYEPFRAFVGIVSRDRPIATINVVERLFDGDDVDYDTFQFLKCPEAIATGPVSRPVWGIGNTLGSNALGSTVKNVSCVLQDIGL